MHLLFDDGTVNTDNPGWMVIIFKVFVCFMIVILLYLYFRAMMAYFNQELTIINYKVIYGGIIMFLVLMLVVVIVGNAVALLIFAILFGVLMIVEWRVYKGFFIPGHCALSLCLGILFSTLVTSIIWLAQK